ncbi:MAG: beta-lactamase family protein [Gemmatimonadetes bacterium]|nr:beta-lactamase family protein [Gemmatimonadota bacterium]MYB08197.1 beta-lactamase family protein [Gemmatimonadota bacterium]MYE14932.1 beta-lactamase family protein [Gemmatimonadota bacterium]MYG24070.1 beta-lactamase family protein [Gemmatimonadota bacterium]MYJ38983.1 beta-lactamase family protein [Gemmatimonadota bacterium]
MIRLASKVGRAALTAVVALQAVLASVVVPAPVASQQRGSAGGTVGTPAEMQAVIEGVQTPNRQGLDVLTLEEVMERFGVPGISVAVIHDFEVHWAKGYGVADVETGAPVDVETLFQAASISKPVTAMAAMVAVQEGRFKLDDDINSILTSWQLPGNGFTGERPVTPRLLFSHTAGLGDGHGFPGYDPGVPRPTAVQILDGDEPSNVEAVTMVRPPLTAMHYSGGGTTIMQLALTDVFGEPFPELMRKTVLEPVGMTTSTFEQPLPPDRDANATRAHAGGRALGDAKWHVYSAMAAAGLWTNARDLARFAIEVQKAARRDPDRVITAASAAEMLSPVGVGDFAVGFSIAREGQGWYFSHGGGNWGFTCYLVAHKAKGYGAAVMTNASGGGQVFREVMERIQRAYGWDSLDKPTLR